MDTLITPVDEYTPTIAHIRRVICDLFKERRLTMSEFRTLEWGITALIEKENRMVSNG